MSVKTGSPGLKPNQVEILRQIYLHRFTDIYVLADIINYTKNNLYRRIEVLIRQGYVIKRQDSINKIKAIPAAYALTPKGIRALKNLTESNHIPDKAIKACYKDKTISQEYINTKIKTQQLTYSLKKYYPGLKIYTPRQMQELSYFPSRVPDAFLSLKLNENIIKNFFLDYLLYGFSIPETYKKITIYLKHMHQGGWDVTGRDLPAIILIAENADLERKIRKFLFVAKNKYCSDREIKIYTSNLRELDNEHEEQEVFKELNSRDRLGLAFL